MTFHPSLGCSSISFRHKALPDALRTIEDLGFSEIDLGALPGVCDHVPYVLDETAVDAVADELAQSSLSVRSVNGDIGDLNRPLSGLGRRERDEHLRMLLMLTGRVGAKALVLPCGALEHEPVESLDADIDRVASELRSAADTAREFGLAVWTESLHFFRLCFNSDRAALLHERLAGTDVGIVLDFSHVTASGGDPVTLIDAVGDRISHVHLRDAVPGNINLSIGNGQADFAGGIAELKRQGYAGHFALELETRDVTDDERPSATRTAAETITALLER